MPELFLQQPINCASPLNRGLVSWWLALPGGSRGNTWRDLTRRSNATLNGIEMWSGAKGRNGGYGAVNCTTLRYGSTDNYQYLDKFTIIAWVRPNGAIGTSQIVTKYPGGGNSFNWFFRPGGNSGFHDGSTFRQIACTAPTSSIWSQVVLAYDGTNLHNYVNGVLKVTTAAAGPPVNATAPITIGRQAAGLDTYSGALDDIRIYSRSLSAAEIASMYSESGTGYPSTLNWIRRTQYVEQAGGAATNRRRRQIICGTAV